MNKGGFSWKRATGISGAKSNISKKIGIPLTKSGRHQKIGRTVSKGCFVTILALLVPIVFVFLIVIF